MPLLKAMRLPASSRLLKSTNPSAPMTAPSSNMLIARPVVWETVYTRDVISEREKWLFARTADAAYDVTGVPSR